jgi:integrase
MLKTYKYTGSLKIYIEGFIEQKRAQGYSYEFEAYILQKFDEYCIQNKISETGITKESLRKWMTLRESESKGYLGQRVSFIRQLLLYMNSLGISTYIPHDFSDREVHVPHILSDEEITAFFHQADSYQPSPAGQNQIVPAAFSRLAKEYPMIFRLIYCCGLRNSEACNLREKDVDLEKGIIAIIHSKGDKDRLVYLSEDMIHLLKDYFVKLRDDLDCQTQWVFPGKDPQQHLPKTSVDRKFNEFWNKTDYANICDKKPTVHSLRHSFVVKRINNWMEQGLDLNVMMPYLSKYLGHKGREESFYYYHQVDSAFRIIRQKDTKSANAIPEVPDND